MPKILLALLLSFPVHAAPLIVLSPDIGRCGEGFDGCTELRDGVCYVWANASSLRHEIDGHCMGGRHTPWQWINGRRCATITVRGESDWNVGDTHCRREDGSWAIFQ